MSKTNKNKIRLLSASVALSLSVGSLMAKTLDPDLIAKMHSSDDSAVHEVVITFDKKGPISAAEVNALTDLGINTGISLSSLPMVGALATRAQIEALYQREDIRSIWENEALQYENHGATAITGVQQLRNDQGMRIKGMPYSGRGVGVVINDSGVDGNHGDVKFGRHLVQNVAGQTNLKNLVEEELGEEVAIMPVTYQEDVVNTDLGGGHGSHVAGTVGGSGAMSNGYHAGVAPGADLIGYGSGAGLFILDALGGFDYALNKRHDYNIRVISNSFGSTSDIGNDFNPDHPTNIATKALSDEGVIVVFSAGNSGEAAEHTITGNFKKAPWIVTVGAGDKDGNLAKFSSLGLKGHGGTVTIDGETMTWEDRPTVVAPGVDIISVRASTSSLQALAATKDAKLPPAYAPYYSHMSGTSMAAPHVAGIVALMLEANPALTWREVKRILQDTATNMAGREAWEVGGGYVNADAAVRAAADMATFGDTNKLNREFNARVKTSLRSELNTSVSFNPVGPEQGSQFEVTDGASMVVAQAWMDDSYFVANTLGVTLEDPNGKRYHSGRTAAPVLRGFVGVAAEAVPGIWTLYLHGTENADVANYNGAGVPDTVPVTLKQYQVDAVEGIDDTEGHAARAYIEFAIAEQLMDARQQGFAPDELVTKWELADALSLAGALRQAPNGNQAVFADLDNQQQAVANAAVASGGALKDHHYQHQSVMQPDSASHFGADNSVNRESLAYSLIQALGLESKAQEKAANNSITVKAFKQTVTLEDFDAISPALRGHVQLALDKGLLRATISMEQGPFDLEPRIVAHFNPTKPVTRAKLAMSLTQLHSEMGQ